MRYQWMVLAVVASIAALMLSPTLAWAARPTPTPTPLPLRPAELFNADFEGGGETWPLQDGIGEIQVPPGWRAYYVDKPPAYVTVPTFCYDETTGKRLDDGCFWSRPEFRDVTKKYQPNRIHGGVRAQKYFSYGRMHEAGLMQRVTGVISGTQYHFAIYMQAWMCVSYVEHCKGGNVSDQPTTMHMRVGIDPTGGTNPFSPNIVWSPEVDSFDRWTQYSVEAVAQGDAITVYTHSRPEWTDTPRQNNDVYVDDATLAAVGTPQPSPQPTSSGGDVASTSTPAPLQSTSFSVRPQQGLQSDGSMVHVVQPNDTLFGIALAYGVTVDQIMQLNNLQPGDYLHIGERLIVQGPTNPLAPKRAASPQPTAARQPQSAMGTSALAPQPIAVAAAPTSSGLCVQAFSDRNNNHVHDGNEEPVADVKFTLLADADEIAAYTTTGVDEPHCFIGLPARAYVVRIEPPKNYVATTETQVGVALVSGQTANVSFGIQAPGDKNASAGSDLWTRYGEAISGVFGTSVLIVVSVIGFVFVSRRKSSKSDGPHGPVGSV